MFMLFNIIITLTIAINAPTTNKDTPSINSFFMDVLIRVKQESYFYIVKYYHAYKEYYYTDY